MDFGSRVKLARNKARLSMKELAQLVGVSTTSISKMERNLISPRQSTLLRLAKALSVSVEYFFREVRVDTLSPTYRKHSKLGKKEQEALEAVIMEAVERHLMAIQIFKDDLSIPVAFPRFPISTVEESEVAANRLRQSWDLGSGAIEHLSGRLENNEIMVIKLDGPSGFDGLSCWANGHIPVIAFNENVPGDRQRFNIAHELGHLVLDLHESQEIESAAHRFAAAFLVPAEAAFKELGEKRSNLSFAELLILKHKYGFSVQAWIRRAFDLGIINHGAYSGLFRQLSVNGWRTAEPGYVPNEKPVHLPLLVNRAMAENLITPSYADTLLGKHPQGFHKVQRNKLSAAADKLTFLYANDPELRALTDADLGAYER
jgi:Zn-dependent peptidase ImmA (M78 family)/DNA-binding XRE family transcriptional regulator